MTSHWPVYCEVVCIASIVNRFVSTACSVVAVSGGVPNFEMLPPETLQAETSAPRPQFRTSRSPVTFARIHLPMCLDQAATYTSHRRQ
jgi:hypothetical protein